SHLMLAVLAAAADGVTDFALIHDSFATHAARSGRWVVTVRKALLDLYETFDPYATIHRAASAALSPAAQAKLPAPPARGSLDLRNILRA
ncbi:DNA-directed RNA polymerase, partial [Acinetobacter baumannii]